MFSWYHMFLSIFMCYTGFFISFVYVIIMMWDVFWTIERITTILLYSSTWAVPLCEWNFPRKWSCLKALAGHHLSCFYCLHSLTWKMETRLMPCSIKQAGGPADLSPQLLWYWTSCTFIRAPFFGGENHSLCTQSMLSPNLSVSWMFPKSCLSSFLLDLETWKLRKSAFGRLQSY